MARAPLGEFTQEKVDKVTGDKTTTKVKAASGRDIAALAKMANETSSQAIGGIDVNEEKERKIDRIVWRRNKEAA
jgi:hypothetical protein